MDATWVFHFRCLGPKVLQAVRQQKNAALQWAVVTPRRKASPEAGRKLRAVELLNFTDEI